jgi:hypothetical protein
MWELGKQETAETETDENLTGNRGKSLRFFSEFKLLDDPDVRNISLLFQKNIMTKNSRG